jgi:hypothetical protein
MVALKKAELAKGLTHKQDEEEGKGCKLRGCANARPGCAGDTAHEPVGYQGISCFSWLCQASRQLTLSWH